MKVLLKKLLSTTMYNRVKRLYYRFIVNRKITPLPDYLNAHLLHCYEWFKLTAKYLSINRLDGVYAEFGCHEVNTFRFALNILGKPGDCVNKIYRFYAFDSFEGMPKPEGKDQQKIWRKGMNFTSEAEFRRICKRDLHRITTVKGFYKDVLPGYKWDYNHKIILAYIDCDYYSSAVEVLKFIKDKMAHGGIIIFDDWHCYYGDPLRGEKRAFQEFQKELEHEVHFEPFLSMSLSGMCSFIYLKKDLMGKEIL